MWIFVSWIRKSDMKPFVLLVIGLTLLEFAIGHHDNEEDHLLNSLIESHVNNNAVTRAKTSGAFGNYIDNLELKVIEKIKHNLAGKEPYPVPELPVKEIRDQNVQITIKLTDVKESKASELKVNKLSYSYFSMTEQFDVTLPALELEGTYQAKGKILGKDVDGDGDFKVWITNLHSWGKSYAHLVHGSLELKQLNVDYTVQDIKAEAKNLKVEGLSEEQVNKILETSLEKYFTDNERVTSDTAGEIIRKQLNTFLNGKSLIDLINWMKRFTS